MHTTTTNPPPKASRDGGDVIKLAVRLMQRGQARGWSDALKQAKEKVKV